MSERIQTPRIRNKNQSFLILNNIAKDANFGFLIRTANAFGAVPVVVGRKRYSRGGACAGTGRTPVMHFHSLEETVENLRTRDCEIIGIEITPNARPVDEHPFESSAAFIVGNEGEGLIDRQRQYCDRFVYIPQFGSAVSLNVNLAAGIVLHRYACWAGYAESPRQGEKFRDPTGGDLDCRVAEKETPRT